MPKDGGWHALGLASNRHFATEGDAERVRIDNEVGWNPANIVKVTDSAHSTDNPHYPITAVGYSADIPPSDTYLCHTGVVFRK